MTKLGLASVSAVALLAVPGVVLVAKGKRVEAAVERVGSPVRCDRDDDRRAYRPGRPIAQPMAPPPVYAAPPPLVVAAEPAADMSVTAARSASQSLASSAKAARGFRMARPGMMMPQPVPENRERYAGKDVAAIHAVADAPVSTFGVDVDTGSYSNVRRMLMQGQLPPAESVRTEEMLNYFRYDYPKPADRARPFSVTTEVTQSPWNASTRLLRIGLRGYDVAGAARPAANLVFLIDVSGSMDELDKLPLVKAALNMLADRLGPKDRVSIVVYAGAAGLVLSPTNEKAYVHQAIDCLSAGGSTAGGAGLALAYKTARASMIQGGINRVILATDGDFNVGQSSDEAMTALIKANRDDGITLTTLGFGEGNYNESMMEKIADVGNGNYAYIDSDFEAKKVLDDELSATLFTIAKDVKLQIEFNPAVVSQYRLIGYENRALNEEDFNNDKVDSGDMGAGHQVTALYEIVPAGTEGWLPGRRYAAATAAASGSGNEAAWLKLRYKLPGNEVSKLIETPVSAASLRDAGQPRGDMAFAVAVAGYGQKLRGDKYLGGFAFADARRLAGSSADPLRQQFIDLTRAAESAKPAS